MSTTVDRRVFIATAGAGLLNILAPQIARADQHYRQRRVVAQEPVKCEISEIITGNRISNEFKAYYKVETGTPGWFYIARYKDTHNQKISAPAYDAEDKRQGKLFPTPTDHSKPVAVVDASKAGLGIFNIYDTGSEYKSSYPISPILGVPSHTEISTDFFLTVDKALKEMPEGLITAFSRNGTEVMLGRNVSDLYYWLYPSWKTQDEASPVNPKKPWIEKVNGEWVDNRKIRDIPGMYIQKRILMPQKYIKYGTNNDEIDQGGSSEWIRSMTYHEAGHGLDYLKSNLYSNDQGFVNAYEKDKAKITGEDELYVAYFLKNRKEPFAELVGALMGGLLPRSAARILNNFPTAAEYVRKNILPKYGYNITQEEIRKKIYPAYGMPKIEQEKLGARFNYKTMLDEDMILCC